MLITIKAGLDTIIHIPTVLVSAQTPQELVLHYANATKKLFETKSVTCRAGYLLTQSQNQRSYRKSAN